MKGIGHQAPGRYRELSCGKAAEIASDAMWNMLLIEHCQFVECQRCGRILTYFSTSPRRYKNDPEILAMTNLVAAYQRNDILDFEKILKVGSSVVTFWPSFQTRLFWFC